MGENRVGIFPKTCRLARTRRMTIHIEQAQSLHAVPKNKPVNKHGSMFFFHSSPAGPSSGSFSPESAESKGALNTPVGL